MKCVWLQRSQLTHSQFSMPSVTHTLTTWTTCTFQICLSLVYFEGFLYVRRWRVCGVRTGDCFTCFYVPSLCVSPAVTQTLPPHAVFLFLTHWVDLTLKMFCGAFSLPSPPSLAFFLPSLQFSYSPVTLISMCPEQYEWVYTPAESTPRLQTGVPSFTLVLSSLTSLCVLTPTKPWLHCMLPAFPPACLIHWLNVQTLYPPQKKIKPKTTHPLSLHRHLLLLTEASNLHSVAHPSSGCQKPSDRSVDHPALLFLSLGSSDLFSRWCWEGSLGCLRATVCACACESVC